MINKLIFSYLKATCEPHKWSYYLFIYFETNDVALLADVTSLIYFI
jgi:hypothetical protein